MIRIRMVNEDDGRRVEYKSFKTLKACRSYLKEILLNELNDSNIELNMVTEDFISGYGSNGYFTYEVLR